MSQIFKELLEMCGNIIDLIQIAADIGSYMEHRDELYDMANGNDTAMDLLHDYDAYYNNPSRNA